MEVNLGKTPDRRAMTDAVHVAVVPLIAGEMLHPGDKFKLAYGKDDVALRADYNGDEALGVVDPFRLGFESIDKGERFWGLVMPGTVTGMRHHWKHPVFDNTPEIKDDHEAWLRNFCDEWNFDWTELIEAGTGSTGDPEWRYATARGRDLHSAGELGEDLNKFWEHLEGYTGKKFDGPHREGMGWSCSC